MIELTSESMRDYQVCQLYYDLKYNQELPTPIYPQKEFLERYNATLKRLISFYFLRRQGELPINYNLMLTKWEKLWFPKGMDAFDLMVEQENKEQNIAHYSTLAAKTLLQFDNHFKSDRGYPLLVDEEFIIPISKMTKLKGKFDLVLKYPDNNYKIFKWIFERKIPAISDYMFNFVIQKLAWDYRNEEKGKPASTQFFIYDLSNSSRSLIPVIIDTKDINAFKYWAKAIENTEHFIPRRGFTIYCRNCVFDSNCQKYEFLDSSQYSFQKGLNG